MCECIEKVNEQIVQKRHSRLLTTVNLSTGVSHVQLATEPVPGYKKQKFYLQPNYCPFCGEKYPDR